MATIVNYNLHYYKDLFKLYCKSHRQQHGNLSSSNIQEYMPSVHTSKIKLLKVNDKIKGYAIYKPGFIGFDRDIINIDEIYIDKDSSNPSNYTLLLESMNRGIFTKRCKHARIFFRNDSSHKSELISMLNLIIEKKQYEMKINLVRRIDAYQSDVMSFIPFKKGLDELNRVKIQNSIFKDTIGHIDCNIDDILREQNQDYYMEDGATFLYIDNNIAGYSQIILEKGIMDKPYIVNFGIQQRYRSLGLSKFLLNHTLHTLIQKGFKEAYITVDADNRKAYNLYKKAGFQRVDTLISYLYRFS